MDHESYTNRDNIREKVLIEQITNISQTPLTLIILLCPSFDSSGSSVSDVHHHPGPRFRSVGPRSQLRKLVTLYGGSNFL